MLNILAVGLEVLSFCFRYLWGFFALNMPPE